MNDFLSIQNLPFLLSCISSLYMVGKKVENFQNFV